MGCTTQPEHWSGVEMAQTVGKLTALKISRPLEPGMYPDGAGLYLQVTSAGAKSWIYRYQLAGKERQMGLGSLSGVTLADARRKAAEARSWRAEGLDPIQARDASRTAKSDMTFKQCAVAFLASHKAGWSEKNYEQWEQTLKSYVYPDFGDSPVREVDTNTVLKALEAIWTKYPVTASRVRGRVESVLDWAKVKGYRAGENPARWRGHLDQLLPNTSKVHKIEHHIALPYKDVPAFMAALRKREKSSTASALEFCILTAMRTSEVLGAHPNEINVDDVVWIVPAERMKKRREHRVPLVGRALEIAKEASGKLLFPGEGNGPLYEDAMLQLLRRMRVHVTVHGFRSSFKDWAAECTNFDDWVSEKALAHLVGDETRRAYQRGELLAKRRDLMTEWDAFCLNA